MRSSAQHLEFLGRALDDHGFFAIIVDNRAGGIRSEILTFAGFASGREKESVVEPHSPHRHHMRTRVTA